MGAYNNYTMTNAVGRVNSEWKYMVRLAIRIREGRLKPEKTEQEKRKFTGIYKRLLTDPMYELYIERDGKRNKEQLINIKE